MRKKIVGPSSGIDDLKKRVSGPAPSTAAASDQRSRDREQAGDQEDVVVADVLPGGRQDDEHHRVASR